MNGYRFREFGQIHKKKESALMIGRMPRDSVLSLFAAPPRIQLIRPHMNPPRKIPPPNRQSNVNPIICNNRVEKKERITRVRRRVHADSGARIHMSACTRIRGAVCLFDRAPLGIPFEHNEKNKKVRTSRRVKNVKTEYKK